MQSSKMNKDELLKSLKSNKSPSSLRKSKNIPSPRSKYTPADQKLYDKVKSEIYQKNPKHSAYRSGQVVKEYKKRFSQKYPNKNPYQGTRDDRQGLDRWFKEEWRNQRGEIGYTKSGDIYRPTKRVTKDTPTTYSELSNKQIKQASKEKAKTGHVKKFNK